MATLNLRNADLPNDLVGLESLIAHIENHDLHPALGERKYFHVVDHLLKTDSISPGLVAEDDAGIIAYLAFMEENGGLWTVETAVHPSHRTDVHLNRFLDAVCREAKDRGGCRIRLWAYTPEVMQAAQRTGFRLERELHHMRAPLPLAETPQFPPGMEIRGFRSGVDEEAWLEGNNRIFSGHPENGNWEMADLDRRRRRSWFSSEGLRMAWDGEELAGFCWTKVPFPRAGEIYVIGVLPGYQGRGLGKSLLLEGIRYMHSYQQARACVLYVEASNVLALNMYRSMGFEHHHTDRSYLYRLEKDDQRFVEGTLSVELRREA